MSVLVLGGINEDVVVNVAALPLPGETILALAQSTGAGGKALNQAVAAARFGTPTKLIGAIGSDAAGNSMRAVMDAEGIDSSGVLKVNNAPTGQAFITVADDGQNTIVVNAGANALAGADHLLSQDLRAKVALTQFEARADAVEALFRAPGIGLRLLNAAPALLEWRPLLALADILVVNETELASFAGVGSLPTDVGAIAQVARMLLAENLRYVIVTLGADGCVLIDQSRQTHFPAFAVSVVDTVGAGDCFCGVLAAALADDVPLHEAIRLAMASAAISVGRSGAACSAPVRSETDAFLYERAR